MRRLLRVRRRRPSAEPVCVEHSDADVDAVIERLRDERRPDVLEQVELVLVGYRAECDDALRLLQRLVDEPVPYGVREWERHAECERVLAQRTTQGDVCATLMRLLLNQDS